MTEATNDKGVSLLPQNPMSRSEVGFDKFMTNWGLQLVPQPTNGGTITKLKGKVRVVIATKTATWQIDDITTGGDFVRGVDPPKDVAGAPLNDVAYYAVKNIKSIGDGYSFDLTFLRTRTALNELVINHAMLDDVHVVDDKGNELKLADSFIRDRHGINDRLKENLQGWVLGFKFVRTQRNSPDGPIKLVWKYPEEFRTVEVPFEFTNLPLP